MGVIPLGGINGVAQNVNIVMEKGLEELEERDFSTRDEHLNLSQIIIPPLFPFPPATLVSLISLPFIPCGLPWFLCLVYLGGLEFF